MAVRTTTARLLPLGGGAPLAVATVAPGDTVFDAFARAGAPLPTRCRASALCGMCRVEVVAGQVTPAARAPDEAALLARVAPYEPEARLGCRITPVGDVDVALDPERWEG